MKKKPLNKAVLLALMTFSVQLGGAELSPALREAERLYQSGRFEEASARALEIHRFFPEDLQTLLVLGMSDFHAGNYLKSSDWFRVAARKAPKHPIVLRYTELLREIEYRTGPFSRNPDRQNFADNKTTAEFYKRGYFGPSLPVPSDMDNQWARTTSLDPVLIRQPLPGTATIFAEIDRPPSELALPTPHPSLESILSSEAVAEMAEKALEKKEYQKSYLFFSQLVASAPQNRRYLIGKAEAAFHMKRYRQVLEILGPMVAAGTSTGFSELQAQKVKQLMEDSRNQVFSDTLKN